MSFKQVVNGTLSYRLVLIEDSTNSQSNILLRAFVHEGILYGKEVHIFCFENFPAHIEQRLNLHFCSSKLIKHDFFSDSVGWLKDSSSQNDVTSKNVFSVIQKPSSEALGTLVIIDSLSSFILLHGFQSVYKQIHQFIHSDNIKGDFSKQLVCVLQPETIVNYEAAILQLRYLTTTWARVMPNRKPSQANVTLKIVYKKANGKCIKQDEDCWIDAYCLLQSKKIETAKEYVNKSDCNELPSQLTTFNIGLKDEEKVARSKVVLPYIKTEAEKAGGAIYYEPDANDDWDEEDPDDDLDI